MTRHLGMGILIAGLVGVLLTGCGGSRKGTAAFSPDPNTFVPVERHLVEMSGAWRSGDTEAARMHLGRALAALDLRGLGSNAEKIRFLDERFRPERDDPGVAEIAAELLSEAELAASAPLLNPIPDPGGASEINTLVDAGTPPALDLRDQSGNFSWNLHQFIQDEIRRVAIQMGEPENFQLPDDFVREIEYYINQFQTVPTYRDFFNRAIRRSRKYIPVLRDTFTEKGFPEEILYLAFIESGFNPVARSRANAVGMFQFIRSTGREYGLTVRNGRDDRHSPLRSAVACREYLHDLLLEFGSFSLALSSYNSGPGKTRKALRSLEDFRDRSFWSLREKTKVLRKETREYVPKIFAAIVAGKPGNAELFGFIDLPYPDPAEYEMVLVPAPVSLSTITGAGGLSRSRLLELNPDLPDNATSTPSRVVDYPLFVPKGTSTAVLAAVKRAAPAPRPVATSGGSRSTPSVKSGSGTSVRYKVRPGNTLSAIAGWFGTSIAHLKRCNPPLAGRALQAGEVLTICDLPRVWTTHHHRVGSGEALSTIAERYGVRGSHLRAWNGIRGDRIYAGQTLVVYQRGKSAPATPREVAAVGRPGEGALTGHGIEVSQTIAVGEPFFYRVSRGNNLSTIASLFGVSVADIQRWNRLNSTQLVLDQRLRIVSRRAFRFFKYRVQNGDTLEGVARRFGAEMGHIRLVNGKNSSMLRANEVISIFSFN